MPALTPRRDSFRIPKRTRHVPEARARVRRILKDWALDPELAHDIATVATELVTNAVRHCRVTLAEVEVVVSVRGCGVLVEVSDPDKEKVPSTDSDPAPEGEGGRGLVLVAGLSERWGHELRPFTKCVWAYFVIPGRSR
ncbi:ATP-binding protein [Streptomyces europaeiscabiei]|uniref:ATP-binding protein n=1 Tax=Streptomyces europaeiscabiei TaxID=146819 RepID=UPI0029A219F3|nr:ATP-binding protein [Streptomyces europaeiscabiei]MDX3631748.1 ATP-binding protein [Streptomyces europaeiscabiei]MDX3649529.1 ATP-binding protein [Streptomyces europaeiscabiei]WUD34401.1 ATP-binding protein [Streptomyces europaeiscabiei]